MDTSQDPRSFQRIRRADLRDFRKVGLGRGTQRRVGHEIPSASPTECDLGANLALQYPHKDSFVSLMMEQGST